MVATCMNAYIYYNFSFDIESYEARNLRGLRGPKTWDRSKRASEQIKIDPRALRRSSKQLRSSLGTIESNIVASRSSKTAPRRLQDAPRRSKTPPRRLQERPNVQKQRITHFFSTFSISHQIGCKQAPRRSNMLQDASKTLHYPPIPVSHSHLRAP